jgi:hypothetical protein
MAISYNHPRRSIETCDDGGGGASISQTGWARQMVLYEAVVWSSHAGTGVRAGSRPNAASGKALSN